MIKILHKIVASTKKPTLWKLTWHVKKLFLFVLEKEMVGWILLLPNVQKQTNKKKSARKKNSFGCWKHEGQNS